MGQSRHARRAPVPDTLDLNNPSGKNMNRAKVERMRLDPEEVCCICHELMKEDENLTYCKFGCGRNLHIDCIEVWVKHKISCGQ